MDPEFNMKNKLLGKKMIANAEVANAIQNNWFGGRKKHKAINARRNKVLKNDIFRQKYMLQLLEWTIPEVPLIESDILLQSLFSLVLAYAQNMQGLFLRYFDWLNIK